MQIASKLQIDYDKYLQLKFSDKLTVQKFLIRENKKFIAKYRPQLNKETFIDQTPMLAKNFTEIPIAKTLSSHCNKPVSVIQELTKMTEKEGEVLKKKILALLA